MLGPKKERGYAVHLSERRYVTVAPDYVKMGEYKTAPASLGYLSGTMKGIWNQMRAVELLQSLPEVDPDRSGANGHSLGGHSAIFRAAFDEQIKCSISNCGFHSFPTYMKGSLKGWAQDEYMPRIHPVNDLKPE